MLRIVSMISAVALCGCAATTRTASGNKIVGVAAAPSGECQSLGNVLGHGGGFWTGGMTTNETLAESAVNDAYNKAAELGATHIQVSPPQFASNSGTSNSATVAAVAFKCPAPSSARADGVSAK
jgi:uncharacterized protein DUF4156